jgi:hypothetical protein
LPVPAHHACEQPNPPWTPTTPSGVDGAIRRIVVVSRDRLPSRSGVGGRAVVRESADELPVHFMETRSARSETEARDAAVTSSPTTIEE